MDVNDFYKGRNISLKEAKEDLRNFLKVKKEYLNALGILNNINERMCKKYSHCRSSDGYQPDQALGILKDFVYEKEFIKGEINE